MWQSARQNEIRPLARLRSAARLAFLLVLACAALAQDDWSAQIRSDGKRTLVTLTRQVALDRAGFSPGMIDGLQGPRTVTAVQAFQRSRGLKQTGEFDEATLAALKPSEKTALHRYSVTRADTRDVGVVPDDWNRKAALGRLKYESIAALLSERGHCTIGALGWLNPGLDLEAVGAGDSVVLPDVGEPVALGSAESIEVDMTSKLVRVFDDDRRLIAQFHCSIAAFVEKRPSGSTTVAKVAFEPEYTFRPEMWPEVKNVSTVLTIPPGPRNPVGLCWVGLGLPGYGIHGTPKPELIGKTGSHGCIRLPNWDAIRLGRMVQIGTPVRFTD